MNRRLLYVLPVSKRGVIGQTIEVTDYVRAPLWYQRELRCSSGGIYDHH
jgi:hypothetical protein